MAAGDVTNFWGTQVPQVALIAAGTDATDGAMRSDYGPSLTMFAPAVAVTAAGRRSDSDVYATPAADSGDSYAAAHVAGAAALYLETHQKATPAEVRTALIEAATPDVVINPGRSPNRLLSSDGSTARQ